MLSVRIPFTGQAQEEEPPAPPAGGKPPSKREVARAKPVTEGVRRSRMLTPSVTAFGGDSSLREGAFLRLLVDFPFIGQAQEVIGADVEELGDMDQAGDSGIGFSILV